MAAAKGGRNRAESDDELLRSFLSSPAAAGIEYVAAADQRTIAERFFRACEALGHDPADLAPEDLRAVVRTSLPREYAPSDPLGQRTIDVLRTFLTFVAPGAPAARVRARVEALEEVAEPFRARIRGD